MKTRLILTTGVAVLLALGACFDSLVNDKCAAGYALSRGTCVPSAMLDGGPDGPPDSGVVGDAGSDGAVDAPDAMVDAAPDSMVDAAPDSMVDAAPDAMPDAMVDAALDAMVDAPPDALVCTLPQIVCRNTCLDVSGDPDNCGACGRVCASGVCSMGVCSGGLRGHIVAIGHDYRSHHPAMARVIGNAVALGTHNDVAVGRLRGTAVNAASAGTTSAIATAMATIGRPFHATTLPNTPLVSTLTGLDVLVVDAQTGDGAAAEALGTSWRIVITAFLARGGVVIVLEGAGGVGYRFAIGANLYTVLAPVDATNELATVTDGADVTTLQVVSPYLAESTSVTLPGPQHAVITAADGGTVVFHITR